MAQPWQSVKAEWRASRRLRLAVLAAALILTAHLVGSLADYSAALSGRYRLERQLLDRMQAASAESAWPARASEAAERLSTLRDSIPPTASAGLAQAELQARLTQLASTAGLDHAVVRTEATVDVPGHPELWQVLARLDAELKPARLADAVQALSTASPWIQLDRLEIHGPAPIRVSLIARGYFRRTDAPESGE